MIRKTNWCLVVMMGLAWVPGTVRAQDAVWQANHDAGWAAYKEGRFAEAETKLRVAEKQARGFGENDPRLATILDHLAWILCAEGKPAEGEPLAKSALSIREKALGAEHPDVAALRFAIALTGLNGRRLTRSIRPEHRSDRLALDDE